MSRAGARTIGGAHQLVDFDTLEAFLTEELGALDVDGKNVVLVVPDTTRSCPLPSLLKPVHRLLIDRVASLTAIIALGTHSYLEPEEIDRWFGVEPGGLADTYPGMTVLNHEWADPSALVEIGTISADEIERLAEGRWREPMTVEVNRHVVESDLSLVIGPVFPHEVVGVSGGNKYFIPGCSTKEAIDLSHWVAALIDVENIIGARGITPPRAIINAGTSLLACERRALCVVVRSGSGELESASFGTPDSAWEQAADIALASHVVYVDKPFSRVLAVIPERYDDTWTAAKGCYKVQPAMAAGGEIILYAPHITQLSETHPEIEELGHHCMDYFLSQWDRFKDYPKGVIGHSTSMKGSGTYDPVTGEEIFRFRVTLATSIPREMCEQVHLGYLDPASIDLAEWESDPDVFVQHNAGEVLYRLSR
jgi:nickel-dependent lactate racemase